MQYAGGWAGLESNVRGVAGLESDFSHRVYKPFQTQPSAKLLLQC